ncbi:hypothetical protein GCM10023156_39030 [Novipirellula rosea]|uniref:Uncharacterized protein n=1 Tax=Novipirellula rosea TaxID=1031540 RepID=A0ABP8N520_9BACT
MLSLVALDQNAWIEQNPWIEQNAWIEHRPKVGIYDCDPMIALFVAAMSPRDLTVSTKNLFENR